jgi:hypothetical protein
MTLAATQPLPTGSSSLEPYSPQEIDAFRRSFEEKGYVVLPGAVPPPLVAEMRGNIEAEFEKANLSGELFAGGGRLTGHLNCFPGAGARPVYEALQQRGIIGLVRQLFPKAVRLPNVGCNFNLPGSVEQHYHADRPFTNDFLIVNVAVVDTDVLNGAIDVLPGTHRAFQPFWRMTLQRAWRASTRIPMKQGDVLVRTSNLWHRGMPNRTDLPRPMLAFTWEDGGCQDPDPFGWNEGRIAFIPNWYKTNFLGRLRERTYMAAPVTYSAYRFVKSLFDGTKGYDH